MRRLLVLFLLTWVPLFAQTEKKDEAATAPKPQRIQKLFMLKYADPRAVTNLLAVFDVMTRPDVELHAISVTATAQTMSSVEEAIAKLDVPAAAAKNIELNMQLVIGSDNEGTAATVPKDLEPVVTQLRNTFPFKNYRLLDVLTLRARAGQRASTDSSGGAMQFGQIAKQVTSSFSINSSSLGPDGTVRLDGLRANSRIPVQGSSNPLVTSDFSYQDLTLNTDVDIKEGQKVVIGRHGITRDQALFLVLSAKVVQ